MEQIKKNNQLNYMDTFTTILGIAVVYSWIHGVIILATIDKKKRTDYQNAVILAGFVFIVLYVVGTLM